MDIKMMDEVTIIDSDGQEIARGTVANINKYREPDTKYAIYVDGYSDLVFVGKDQLQKKETEGDE
ncbi:hypothetical protein [Lysinibacillus boronitolerans]|uniref:Uncharacterized protein n=1 Tax=Lysinibacillus boronitolerans JCM 21713 = 10a = NBRC 103108 TaxID=1294264 RepID=A0ABR4Y447_9BACI|nr:hypothetical protein [Lysinibacillus boronitolerans]KGR88844.1 hypothetical protein CD31_02345 [Lysinibacillus boronitolerans JCM 21713 = 10a = NBRC 103108]